MNLNRLSINRLPGIGQPFEIEVAGSGFHVVFGPNGIGKSSICRAVEALYWEDRGPSERTSVNGEFESDGEAWWGEREGARVRWQRGGEDSVSPNLPPSHNHHCFFLRLRDLIDPSRDGTRDIASEIRRQMSGGFDLDEIASNLSTGVGARHGRRERNDFNRASSDVQKAEGKQAALQRDADRLESLRAQFERAEASARRIEYVKRALGLAERLQEHAGIAAEIAALPEALGKLTGKEVEQIEGLHEQVRKFTERARTLEKKLSNAKNVQTDSGLSAPLDEAELAAWRVRADELSRVELELEAARTEHNACRKEHRAALSAIGNGNVDEVALDLSKHGQLFEFLRASEAHKGRTGSIEERLRLLDRVERHGDGQRDLEKLRGATESLRSWLREPAPETLPDRIRMRRPWILSAIAIATAGAGLAVFVDPWFALLVAAAAGIALPVLVLGNRSASSGERTARQAAFRKFGVEEPDAWDIPSVESRLHSLETETASIEAASYRARDRDVQRQNLENELAGMSEERTSLDARRQELTDSLKLDVPLFDAELVDLARALDQLRSARGKDESAAGKVDRLNDRHAKLLTDLADILDRHGEARPTDAATAMARLNKLAGRNTRLVRAISDEQQAVGQHEEVSGDREAALGRIRQIYSEAALDDGDLHGLTELVESLPHFRDLKSKKTSLNGQIGLDRAELAKNGEADLGQRDKPSLERLHGELSKEAAKADGLGKQIAEINAQVNQARGGTSVQDLIAVREEARERLLNRRDDALFAEAGRFLIDGVEEEYEQTQLPRVFERARNHFSAFTHHNYELRLSKESALPRLFAVELSSGEGRELDELSDGTRAQLLLAARITFAEEVEHGQVLPLFLDEALDQSDPARFEAIVRGLGRVAEDHGRQIFYLTSDPLDVDRIQDALAKEGCTVAAAIDLGLIRKQAASVSGTPALRVGPRPTVLPPDGLSTEEYGVALGVPVFRPEHGYAEQHFFYVLSDDLDLLHDFLLKGIVHAGQWKTVSGTSLAEKLGSRSISAPAIAFRLDLLGVFCELWKQGRGRPVDRDALENSGALSERFLDDVVAIAKELDGNPETLLTMLETNKDPRLKGFRRSSADSLELFLRENGYLDDRPILNEDEVRLRALATPAANELPEGIASECLHRWWAWAAGSSEPGPP